MNDRARTLAYDLYIAAPVTRVWRALVDGDETKHWAFGCRIESAFERGAPYAFVGDSGHRAVEGEVVEIAPESRLVTTWRALWDPSVAADAPSRVAYSIAPAGPETTKLHVVHDELESADATFAQSASGWPVLLSALKTWLETGRTLTVTG